jgi:hypothetical protein
MTPLKPRTVSIPLSLCWEILCPYREYGKEYVDSLEFGVNTNDVSDYINLLIRK